MDKRHGYGYQFYGHNAKLGQSFKTQGIWEAIDTYNYLMNKKSSYFLSVKNKQKTISFYEQLRLYGRYVFFFSHFYGPVNHYFYLCFLWSNTIQ